MYPTKTHYSKHFTRKELECKCGCTAGRVIRLRLRLLAINLERLRRELQKIYGPSKTLGITSGYRCRAYNKKIGGAVASQHIQGKAADLAVPRGQQAKYVLAASKVRAFRRGGIGVYPNGGVHVDMRGWKARWSSFVGQ